MISLFGNSKASLTMAVALVGLLLCLPACSHRKIVQIGTHKVTVSRHGFEKKLHVTENAGVPALEYAGISTDGKGLKVSIRATRKSSMVSTDNGALEIRGSLWMMVCR